MALLVSGVENVATNFCWHFHASAAISVHHAIRSGKKGGYEVRIETKIEYILKGIDEIKAGTKGLEATA